MLCNIINILSSKTAKLRTPSGVFYNKDLRNSGLRCILIHDLKIVFVGCPISHNADRMFFCRDGNGNLSLLLCKRVSIANHTSTQSIFIAKDATVISTT